MLGEAIAPNAKIAGSQESNSLVGERVAEVPSDARNIGDITTPRLEVGLIAIKCAVHCNGLAVITVAIAANAGNDAGAVLGLPEIESIAAVGLLEIVGVPDRLCPVAAPAVSDAHYPSSSRLIAAIPQTDARADLREHGLPCHRKLQAGRSRF
jgi:hypothetical protein